MPSPAQQIIQELNPPSKLKYFFFGFIAFVADGVDIIAGLTGIGIVVSVIVDIIVAPILFIGGWSANSRIKKMREVVDGIHLHIERMERRLIQIRRIYAGALRVARRIPGLRRSVRRVALTIRRARLGIIRNPVFKNIAAMAVDIVAYIDFVPWRTWAIYSTYKDEKRTYEEAMENARLALAAENQMVQYEIEARRELLAA
mgnify:CR=1 FL=1